MTPATAVLALVDDRALRDDVDRVAAAAAVRVVHARRPSSRTVWVSAQVVVLDAAAAARCADEGLPRRDRVYLVGTAEPGAGDWKAAVSVGAQRVIRLPDQDGELVDAFTTASQNADSSVHRGAVIATVGGCGGAGASLFAAALAQAAPQCLLVDTDPWGGGLDLAMGTEGVPGLRWQDLTLRDGRLGFEALRTALPARGGVTVLSGARHGAEIEAGPLSAVIDAGRTAGVTVVCDVPRRATRAVETALESADLVVMVVPADVRAAAAAGALTGWVRTVNPNVGLVVRGPAPGGLRAGDIAATVGLPLVAAMRPQPGLADTLERGGLRMRARSPLARAAAGVLGLLS
ncbi:septum site-determining protein Ssd [Mycolicibacterium sp. P9-22]|uniref:septum site-determining protein Ssd n=1 Tax=Mycolicibacterium sp. P9-22 TaxID=2024613 RepID=UPI0011EC5008|nr:septum site-determining protein Ssd [Mycolicibacterium sp. P9-22]KAA0116744.1 AAA family ATPase [Mycolicibacterium sp. P9-22]